MFQKQGRISREGGYKERLETIKMIDGIPTCEIGHKMEISSFADSGYDSGFYCDICYEHYSTPLAVGRWFCEVCYTTRNGKEYHGEDICLTCVPVKGMVKKMVSLWERR